MSRATLYRGLRRQLHPRPLHRSDRGKPKIIPAAELERYCETIAAMKLRTLDGKGRHLSTAQAIRILEEDGGRDARRSGLPAARFVEQDDCQPLFAVKNAGNPLGTPAADRPRVGITAECAVSDLNQPER